MDGFALVMLGGVAAVGLLLWLIGRSAPGTGAENVGLDAREIEERRMSLEIEDEQQIQEALAQLRARRAAREAGGTQHEAD